MAAVPLDDPMFGRKALRRPRSKVINASVGRHLAELEQALRVNGAIIS